MEEGRSRNKCLINQHFHNPLQELCESPLHAECLQFSVILMAARWPRVWLWSQHFSDPWQEDCEALWKHKYLF